MMNPFGMNFGYLLAQCVFSVGFLVWLIVTGLTLLQLRNRSLSDLVTVLWVAVVLGCPVLGSIAFWVVQPGRKPVEVVEPA